MSGRTWEEKAVAYQAKHNAYLDAWDAKDAAWKEANGAFEAEQKAGFAAFDKAHKEAMGPIHQETIASGRAHAAATSAYSKPLALL